MDKYIVTHFVLSRQMLTSILSRPKLKDHMQYCVDHPEEVSKLAKVKAQVSEVKGVMMENIEKVDPLLILPKAQLSFISS